MKERPILFSAPMVKAILEERKTQTRRIIKKPPEFRYHTDGEFGQSTGWLWNNGTEENRCWAPLRMLAEKCPFGKIGDLLWVRETFATDGNGGIRYAATDDIHELRKKKPSIFMPRWASRITLEITDIRIEKLQDISHKDAREEGYEGGAPFGSTRMWYEGLWQIINGPGSWQANPWVWVIEFKRLS